MNLAQSITTIIMLMAATMVTRFLPFLIFKPGDDMPKFIKYLATPCPLRFSVCWWFTVLKA